MAASRAGVSSQPVTSRSSSASSSDSESEPSGDRSGPAASSSRASARGRRVAGAAADLLAIAAHGVDLAVVRDGAERLGQAPDGMGVGRVTLVEDGVAERARRLQVRVEVGQSPADDQALVDDRPGRGRRDRDLGEGSAGDPRGRLEAPARDDQPALEGVIANRARIVAAAGRAGHDRLGERRPGRRGRRAERGDVARDRSPGRHRQSGLGEDRFDQGARPSLGRSTARKEERHDRRAARRRRRGRRSARAAVRSSGRATPAPSLDSPSAPNAPRWPRAPRPASASGSTRSRECPPASATKPTPQASCSKRASYNGVAGRRLRGRW